MKTVSLFFICSFFVFVTACRSKVEPEPEHEPEPEISYELTEEEIIALGISREDAIKELSHEPTGVVEVETTGLSVNIDFEPDEFFYKDNITKTCYWHDGRELWESAEWVEDYGKATFDTIPSFGKLIAVYKAYFPYYRPAVYSSIDERIECRDADYRTPKIEYALAQECMKDDCTTQTRKVILQRAIEQQKRKMTRYTDRILMTHASMRTGMLLMSVILVKENYDDFLNVIHENPDLQSFALNLKWHDWNDYPLFIEENLSEIIFQYATDFINQP